MSEGARMYVYVVFDDIDKIKGVYATANAAAQVITSSVMLSSYSIRVYILREES